MVPLTIFFSCTLLTFKLNSTHSPHFIYSLAQSHTLTQFFIILCHGEVCFTPVLLSWLDLISLCCHLFKKRNTCNQIFCANVSTVSAHMISNSLRLSVNLTDIPLQLNSLTQSITTILIFFSFFLYTWLHMKAHKQVTHHTCFGSLTTLSHIWLRSGINHLTIKDVWQTSL